MTAIQLPQLTDESYAKRLTQLFPAKWTNSKARTSGGILFGILRAIGSQLAAVNDALVYAKNSTRIATAISNELDIIALDYFGTTLVRRPEETDDSFRTRILSHLLPDGATRAAVSSKLAEVTGVTPRILEPWSTKDNACYNKFSFYGIDTISNPGRYGSPKLRYQGFVISPLPSLAANTNKPIRCYNKGAAYNRPDTVYWRKQANWFASIHDLDEVINRVKVFGTVVWRQYRRFGLTIPVMRTQAVSPGDYSKTISIPLIEGAYGVIAQASWNTTCFVPRIGVTDFDAEFGVEADENYGVDWIATPVTTPASGRFPPTPGTSETTLPVRESAPGYDLFITPNWSTPFWESAYDDNGRTISWAAEVPVGGMASYLWLPPEVTGKVDIDEDAITTTFAVPNELPYKLFLLPSWNTTMTITKSDNEAQVDFSNPAPADAYLRWACKIH